MKQLVNQKDVFKSISDYSERAITVSNEDLMGVKVRFHSLTDDKNMHTHAHQQLTLVLKGSFKFYRTEEEIIVKAGDSLLFESNIEHGCIPLEEDSELFDVFTPMREDFL